MYSCIPNFGRKFLVESLDGDIQKASVFGFSSQVNWNNNQQNPLKISQGYGTAALIMLHTLK